MGSDQGTTSGARSLQPVRPPGAVDWAGALTLAVMWGLSYVFVKIAVSEMTPMMSTALRILVAGAVLLAVLAVRGTRLPRSWTLWRPYVVIGLFGNVLPFLLIGYGTRTVATGEAALLMASGPFASHLLSHFTTEDDRLTLLRGLGLACGFGGILLIVDQDGLSGLGGFGERLIGQIAILAAAVAYAISGMLTRTAPAVGALAGSSMSVAAAAAIAVPAALLEPVPMPQAISSQAIIAILYLGALSGSASALIRFGLIRNVGLTFVSMVSYVVPVLGVIFGAVLLGEPVGLAIMLALGLVTAGMVLNRLGGR